MVIKDQHEGKQRRKQIVNTLNVDVVPGRIDTTLDGPNVVFVYTIIVNVHRTMTGY